VGVGHIISRHSGLSWMMALHAENLVWRLLLFRAFLGVRPKVISG
jgi:hypothetical protein